MVTTLFDILTRHTDNKDDKIPLLSVASEEQKPYVANANLSCSTGKPYTLIFRRMCRKSNIFYSHTHTLHTPRHTSRITSVPSQKNVHHITCTVSAVHSSNNAKTIATVSLFRWSLPSSQDIPNWISNIILPIRLYSQIVWSQRNAIKKIMFCK